MRAVHYGIIAAFTVIAWAFARSPGHYILILPLTMFALAGIVAAERER